MNLAFKPLISLFVLSFAFCWLSCFLMRKIAKHLKIMDYPDERKIHINPTPYLGGVAMFIGLWAAFIFMTWLYPPSYFFKNELQAILIGAGISCLFGVWDDVKGSGAIQKLTIQIIIGYFMYKNGFRIEKITFPFDGIDKTLQLNTNGLWITILWYVLIMNAINLIDGLDGLASGISAIVAFTIFMVSLDISSFLPLGLLLIILGISLGFLYHNFYPAKIFMGDAGSLTIGFLLATATLMSSTKTPALLALIIPILALGIPIFDTSYAFIRRTLDGKHPFKADKRHLHHRLLALGLPHRNVVILIYYISGFIGMLTYILSKSSPSIIILTAVLIGLGLLLLVENLSFLEKNKK